MKYKKGTFVIVPNKEKLKGKPPEMLSVYFWLCHHADDDGICFPTKKTISLETGCSHNTVDKYLKMLVQEGFLTIIPRKKAGSKENTSNYYQLMVWDDLPQAVVPPLPPRDGSETISSINSNNLTISEQEIPVKRVTLSSKGKTPVAVLQHLYGKLFNHLYGFFPTNFAQQGAIFKELLKSYTEIQLASLLIVFFNWQGMNDNDSRSKEFLISHTHSIALFKSNISQYQAYIMNVKQMKEEWENDEKLIVSVKESILNLST